MNLKNIPTDELFRKFAGTRLTGHWDSKNVSRGRSNMKEAAQKRKKISQEMTKRFFGSGGGTSPATKYDLALELAPDVYALQQGGLPSLALKVLLSTCLSPANPNATRDDLLRFCILKTPSVNRQTQTHLTDLPPEILIMIAAFIPNLSDVAKASMTCTELRSIFWNNNAVFRAWVKQPKTRYNYYSSEVLVFPGVEKTYPELYYRAFLEDPVRGQTKIPWKEVAFRWFSWLLLFYNQPSTVITYTEILRDLSLSGKPKTSLSCIQTGHDGCNSPLFCANCHRVPKRIYAKHTLCVSFDNAVFGFNCMAVCGKCWTYSKRSSVVVLPVETALKITKLHPKNALLNQRMFHLDPGPYQKYARYTKGSMVTTETVVYAMLVRWGKLHLDIKYVLEHQGEQNGIYLKTKEAILAEFERNWKPRLKKQGASSQPPPRKKPRLGNP